MWYYVVFHCQIVRSLYFLYTLMAGPCALFHFTRVRLAVLERRYVV